MAKLCPLRALKITSTHGSLHILAAAYTGVMDTAAVMAMATGQLLAILSIPGGHKGGDNSHMLAL